MLLMSIISLMVFVAFIGRASSRISAGTYLAIFLLSLIQVALVLAYVYTTEMPPLL